MPAGDLYDEQVALLNEAIAALDTLAPGLQGAPERAFVSSLQPALDCCPQLTVHLGTMEEDPQTSNQNVRRSAWRNRVQLTVTIARCITVIEDTNNLPPVADLEADAEQHSADGWALWNVLHASIASGDLFRLCAGSRPTLRPLPPQGGCGGWQLTYTVELDGY